VGNDLVDARVGQIVGSTSDRPIADPQVTITAYHDIVRLVAGEISSGTANGYAASAGVRIEASNDILELAADQINGGMAVGDGALAGVSIKANRNIGMLTARTINGGTASGPGALAYVQIWAGADIQNLLADSISGGQDGLVQILAGEYDIYGNLVGGNIVNMVVGEISGASGVVNIAAGGDIESLRAKRIISGADGEVNIIAGGDITVDVKKVSSWILADGTTGVQFSAGGEVDDIRNTISSEFIDEGVPPEFPGPV
ncbi:MAG: hypothetical protein NTU94_15915, partial [Planctomycetota bacterium]|nr:hypothetical protein [Planctomycetota bacterium]